ncbi:MAG TPA: D-alanyl-D-alanine carboxypeptidase [Clostridiales bacterium]|nr:D-alanyl-D-alanine carboxypeptidase [Clostridiales bacterium]
MKKIRMFMFAGALMFCLAIPALAAPSVSAQSFILMHADTGVVLCESNADEKMLVASTTKIMTAIVAIENCDLDEQVEISAESAGIEGSSMYLRAGETYTVEQLLYGMMLVSGNDAATALALHVAGSVEGFAECMNERAAALGMDNSSFKNPHGLDEDGHYSTARDMAVLACHCMANDTFRKIVSARSYQVGDQTFVNHNRLLWTLDGALGLKTGYTRAAGRSLVSCVERDGLRFICVTLSDPDDWADHTSLYDWAFAECQYKTIASDEMSFTLPVISGTAEDVTVYPEMKLQVLAINNQEPELSVDLPRFVFAPVEAGDIAGSIMIMQNGIIVGSRDLVYSESISLKPGIELTPWERFKRVWTMAGRYCGYSYYLTGENR